ncbi:MAG TPA: hypothetical protein PKH23_03895, partial [Bacillota bacterium]|nr:hypothetical protein [Bacillota bacterium]
TNHIIDLCQQTIRKTAEELWNKKKPLAQSMTSDNVRDQIQKTLYDYSRRRPVIMVSVIPV